jgi:creatinine amidohydrolase/Fe(II)-dependent formamide hydrolase-like protein
MGLACEFVTSLVLALRPELVRQGEIHDDPQAEEAVVRGLFTAEGMKQRTDQGAVGYPEQASAESGRAFLAAVVARTVEVVQALLHRPLPEE